MAKFVGLDPGINAAVGVIEREASGARIVLARQVITDTKLPLEARLKAIWDVLSEVLRTQHPVVVGIENQVQAQVAQSKRDEFTSNTSKVNEVVGLMKGCCLAYGYRYLMITPARAKIALLGPRSSRASKDAIKTRVEQLWGRKLPEHAADAVAVALGAEQALRKGQLVQRGQLSLLGGKAG